MDLKFRRPIIAYLFPVLLILWSLYKAFHSPTTFNQFLWYAVTLLASVILTNILRKRNYFEISGNKLIINRDFFRTRTIELDEIEKINFGDSWLLTSPSIILKNKTKIKFNNNYLDTYELKKTMEQLGIPIELAQ
jgi:hypothetical protein